MVVYLPIAFLKDWLCNSLKRRSSKSGKNAETLNDSSAGLNSPLKHIGGQKTFELEHLETLSRKDSETDLSAYEEGRPLVSKHRDDTVLLKQEKSLTTREIAMYGFYIAPIWFVTEVRCCIGRFLFTSNLKNFLFVCRERESDSSLHVASLGMCMQLQIF